MYTRGDATEGQVDRQVFVCLCVRDCVCVRACTLTYDMYAVYMPEEMLRKGKWTDKFVVCLCVRDCVCVCTLTYKMYAIYMHTHI